MKSTLWMATASVVAATSLVPTQAVQAKETQDEVTMLFEATKATTLKTPEGITITGSTHLERWLKYRLLQGDTNIRLADYYVLAGEKYNGTQFIRACNEALKQPELQGVFQEDVIWDQEETYEGYPIYTPHYHYDAETLKASLTTMRTFVEHEAKRVKAYKTEAGQVKAAYDIAKNFKLYQYDKHSGEALASDWESYLFTLRTGQVGGSSGAATLVYLVMKEAGLNVQLSASTSEVYSYPYYDDIVVTIKNKQYYVNPYRAVKAKNNANIWGGYLLMSDMDRITMTGVGSDIDGDPKKLRSKLEFYNKKKQVLDGDIVPALSNYLVKNKALTKGTHQYVFRIDGYVVRTKNLTPAKLKKQLAKRYPKMKNIQFQLEDNYMKVKFAL